MGPYLEAIKEQFMNLIDDIKTALLAEAEVRIAVVGYKDHSDMPNIEFLDFTLSFDQVDAFLKKLVAAGGADAPEDVLGGIRQALMATWKQKTRWIIHIADAPPHARTLHEFYDICDRYPVPGSEPHGLTFEALLKQMIRLDINYSLLRINDFTDRMAFEFFKAYNAVSARAKLHETNKFYRQACSMPKGFRSNFWEEGSSKRSAKVLLYFVEAMLGTNLSTLRHLVFTIVTSSAPCTAASMLPLTTRAKKVRFSEVSRAEEDGDEVELRVDNTLPQWGSPAWYDEMLKVEGFSAEIMTVNTLDEMMADSKHIKISLIELTIFKRSRPFAQGTTHRVFYAHTEASTNRFVVKTVRENENQLAHFLEDMQCQSLCKTFALHFNVLLNSHHPIDFIVATCVTSERGEYLLLEPFVEGNFVTYNNNRGYVDNNKFSDEFNQAAQAFSHFTFERSKGRFLVSDLQGVGYTLIKPSIHTLDNERFQLRKTNFGQDGFRFFFSTHICNGICGKLGLKNRTSMITFDTCQFPQEWPKMDSVVCCSNKLCGEIMHFSYAQESRRFPGHRWCSVCWEQLYPSVIKLLCEEPGPRHEYEVCRFFFESQGQRMPRKCARHRYEVTALYKTTV